MSKQDFKRKLTAILSADVKGYSRLMGEDEEATVRTITAYREVIGSVVQKYRGRVVDSPGDNILAEFVSVVDAVRGAVEIQEQLNTRNAELPENRRMEFRIGVNLGDVIHEEERIYGDGVNVAARVESLAEAGGICVSGTTFDHIETKLPLGYEYLGEKSVKNIAKPVRIYKVLMDPEAAGKVIGEKRVKPKKRQWTNLLLVATLVVIVAAVAIWSLYSRLAPPSTGVAPDQPTIAVLPFDNMSDDPKQVYFADGMTDDLITGLSKISGLFVIARNSTFTYKGKPVKVQQVADELGVRYVVEGSVRRVGDQVRINAQLIDATTGYHLWAEHYDGTLDDIFALQDRINQQIISALAVQLTAGEQSKLASKETSSIEAYDAFLQGWEHYLRRTPEDFAKALPYFKKAIELDKNYGRAYAALALTYWNSSIFGWSKSLGVESSSPARILAREYVEIALKHPTSIAHRVASDMFLHRRNYGEALAEAKRAIAYDPNDAESHIMMGRVLICIGRPEEAIDFLEKAMLLDPRNLAGPLGIIGLARFCTGELQEAVIQTERALKHNPDRTGFASILAVAYAYLGQDQKAQTALASYIKTWGNPPHLPQVMYAFPFKNTEVADRFAEGLLRAGLPGKPSGYYKVSEEHKLTGEEFRSLFFGRRLTGFFVDNQWSIDRTKNGEATFLWNSAVTGVGRSWVEGNRLCNQWQKMFGGLKYCMDVFRNPDGTPEEKSEYLVVTDFGIFGCSTEELASETPDIL